MSALSVIPLPRDIREPFWIQAAQNILTGSIHYYFDLGASFNEALTDVLTTPIDKLIDRIAESNNLLAIQYISQARDLKIETSAGIAMEISNRIMVFATDPQIRDSFAPAEDCIRWEELETHDIYIRVAEDKLGQLDSVISLLLTQLIRTLERRPDRYSPEGRNLPPILLLLEELPRLGRIYEIENAIARTR